MRRELERIPIAGSAEAEERTWYVVAGAYREHEPVTDRHRRRRIVLAVAAAAALAATTALALSPAGAALVRSVRQTVGMKNAAPALTRLPAPGRLLVTSSAGPWVVQADGSKRLLGRYDDAAWSPHGLFVAVTRRHELLAVEPGGTVHWSLARRGPLGFARWAPDGYRIAYLDGPMIRVVNGDGTGDRRLALAAPVAPAWRPSTAHGHVVAFVTAGGKLALVDVDGAVIARRPLPPVVRQLLWSGDGSRLAVLTRRALSLFDRRGRPAGTVHLTGPAFAAAFAPRGREVAVVQRGETRVYDLATGRSRQLFRGAIDDVAWSPDGRWVLLTWPVADQWLFVRSQKPSVVEAVSGIRAQFDPRKPGWGSPRVDGWCCS